MYVQNKADDAPTLGPKEANYAYQLFMLFMCSYAIAALAVGMIFPLTAETMRVLDLVDYVVCAFFLGDFIRNLVRAENRLKYFVTWGWLDLLSSIPAFDLMRAGRVVRILRILRVLRAIKAIRYLMTHLAIRPTSSALYSIVAISFSLVVVSALAVLDFEYSAPGSNIRSAEDALWWSMTTITTVGYGDRYPVSVEGRIVATVLMTAGVGLFGALSGTVAGWFLRPGASHELARLNQERINLLEQSIDKLQDENRERTTQEDVRS